MTWSGVSSRTCLIALASRAGCAFPSKKGPVCCRLFAPCCVCFLKRGLVVKAVLSACARTTFEKHSDSLLSCIPTDADHATGRTGRLDTRSKTCVSCPALDVKLSAVAIY